MIFFDCAALDRIGVTAVIFPTPSRTFSSIALSSVLPPRLAAIFTVGVIWPINHNRWGGRVTLPAAPLIAASTAPQAGMAEQHDQRSIENMDRVFEPRNSIAVRDIAGDAYNEKIPRCLIEEQFRRYV